MKYEALYDLTITQGGATVRAEDYPSKIVMPKTGYAVATSGTTVEQDDKEAFDVVVDKMIAWCRETEVAYFGTWVHDGLIYVDGVEVFASKEFALGVAYARGELAIYDIAAGKEIAIKRKVK
jgi:hypothetical protein